MNDFIIHSDDVIEHFGVKGMKWGKRLRDNHIQNLEYKYRKLGYNEAEVKSKVDKRLRNEKIALAAAGAVGIAVVGHKLKNKIQDDYIGRTIKEGKTFDSVNAASKIDTSRPVYGAYRKMDKMKYRGIYGNERAMKRSVYGNDFGLGDRDNIYTFKAAKNVKIAPNRVARKTFKKLYKEDADFRQAADHLDEFFNKSKNKYNNFNVGLVSRGEYKYIDRNIDKFYSELKKKGFSGVMDMNDKKYSGYRSKNPTIFFDHSKLNISGKKVLTDEQIKKDFAKAMPVALGQNAVNSKKFMGAVTAIGGGLAYKKHRENNELRETDEAYNKKYRRKNK